MIKPDYLRIINDDGFFRLSYKIRTSNNSQIRVKTSGFKTKEELLEILRKDDYFKINFEGYLK